MKMLKTILSTELLEKPRRKLKYFYEYLISVNNNVNGRYKKFKMIKDVRKQVELLQSPEEAYTLMMITESTNKINGAIAEVGVYQGGSALLISKFKENRELHLFDNFNGLPYSSTQLTKGKYKADMEDVAKLFSSEQNITIHKGIFPDNSDVVKDKWFSLVHIDCDIPKCIIDCLNFFYPRMEKGGVILIHDYSTLREVTDETNNFFSDKQEIILELSNQGVIIKM